MAVTTYTVSGMTCNSCSTKLNKALTAVEGVEVKKVCHKSGAVNVVLSEGATAKQVEDAIAKSGYKIVPAKKG
jgi:copper chaperone CopZ